MMLELSDIAFGLMMQVVPGNRRQDATVVEHINV